MRLRFLALVFGFSAIQLTASAASGSDVAQLAEEGVTFTRSVDLAESDGSTINVTQVLKRLSDGSLEYDPSAQPTATREYDARQCSKGSSPGKGPSVWGPETLHGGACFQTFDSVEALESWNRAHPGIGTDSTDIESSSSERASTFIQSSAPGGYIIPVGVNAIHHGSATFVLGANSILEGALVINGGAVSRFREPVAGGRIGTANLRVNVFHGVPGQGSKFVNFCANGLCNSASSQFTVF